MPKEKGSLAGMLLGLEPGPLARLKHDFSGAGEGEWGENSIATMLRNHVIGANVFQNVYIPVKGQDKTSEIDILMFCPFGIFVIESKAFGGKIYGYENANEWTQYLGQKESKFYNPIKQNETHCKNVAEVLGVSRQDLISLIVFEDRADLSKVQESARSNVIICKRTTVHPILKAMKKENGILYSENNIKKFRRRIESLCFPDEDTVKKHVESAQLAKEDMHHRMEEREIAKKAAAESRTCPSCGKPLVLRKGPYSDFYGCSGYPDCRFTMPK